LKVSTAQHGNTTSLPIDTPRNGEPLFLEHQYPESCEVENAPAQDS